ncbi:ADP-ribosylation factor GTPase-activating protein [Musa troglodytarum]|uniref:ADP-ribosylation factor GTPase-activating protein n=1 Tax=Musa troglodytarum TaxID=320322 RepID=A0A9E7GIN7_9LILI|nr:ADP-ribosylation factor GTPase-activating protein [Musa troglodytarum]
MVFDRGGVRYGDIDDDVKRAWWLCQSSKKWEESRKGEQLALALVLNFISCKVEMSNGYHRPEKPASGQMRKLKELMLKSDNRICADCGAQDPKWASANIGVFICLKCSDIHRSLGTDISKVLSVTLDEWSDGDIESMIEVGGNSYANSIYEAFLPRGFPKPKSNSSYEERSKFIRSKYESQEFLKPSLRIVSSKMSFNYVEPKESFNYRIDSNNSNKAVEMRELIGDLKVKVVRGSNLAVRDMFSSDPYVVLTLGDQAKGPDNSKTERLKSNMERRAYTVSSSNIWCFETVYQVYDQDVFSADDIMGEAEVDLQPMITSAMAFGDPELLGNMQIGKWLKTSDNALISDSIVNIVDGKVKQEVSLQLQNVESGEIELELEWIPLDE